MIGQNTSSAVMQQRTEARDSLDDFPTPPWATRALCEWLTEHWGALDDYSCREPAANRGPMVAPLSNVHLAAVVARLDAAGDKEAADTIVWQAWWHALDREP